MATIGESVASQWDRGWRMLLDAVARVPEDDWRRETPPAVAPVRSAGHIVGVVDFYLGEGPEAFQPDPRLGGRPFLAPLEALPSQAVLAEWAEELRAKVDARLRSASDELLLTGENPFPWTGANPLELWVYGLRHLQHHLGEIHGRLRALGVEEDEWC